MLAAEQQAQHATALATDDAHEDRPGRKRNATNGDSAQRPARSRGRLVTRIALVAAGCVVLAAGGNWAWHWWTHRRFVELTNDAYLKTDKVAVSARISGQVEQVLVKDNQSVHAGQALLRIDDRDTRARLEQANAQADQARASIDADQAQIRQQEAQIAQAQAQLDGAQSQLAFAEKETARYAQLAASGAETRQSYDQKRQNRDQARSQVAQNAAALLAAQRQIGTLQAQIQQAQAQIKQAQAQGRQAQVDLDAAVVTARIDGRVGDKSVQAGQYVQTGTRLMTIVPTNALYLVANFKETQVRDMRVGQPVTISVDALDGQEMHGKVESFAPGTGSEFALIPAENSTGNFTKIVQRVGVRISVNADPNAAPMLVPGLSVTAAVDTTSAADPDPTAHAARSRNPFAPADAAPPRDGAP